jgi:hypothetical protein
MDPTPIPMDLTDATALVTAATTNLEALGMMAIILASGIAFVIKRLGRAAKSVAS